MEVMGLMLGEFIDATTVSPLYLSSLPAYLTSFAPLLSLFLFLFVDS
jgi:hypothetical protein